MRIAPPFYFERRKKIGLVQNEAIVRVHKNTRAPIAATSEALYLRTQHTKNSIRPINNCIAKGLKRFVILAVREYFRHMILYLSVAQVLAHLSHFAMVLSPRLNGNHGKTIQLLASHVSNSLDNRKSFLIHSAIHNFLWTSSTKTPFFSFTNNDLPNRLKKQQPFKQEKTPFGVLSIDYPIGKDNPEKEKGIEKRKSKRSTSIITSKFSAKARLGIKRQSSLKMK